MAYEETSIEYKGISQGTYGFIADTVADMNSIPITDDMAPFSTCFVTDTQTAYVLSAQKVWKEV